MNQLAKQLLTILLVLVSASSFAAKFYKYQDEDGNWHYSDRKPGSNVEVEEIRMRAENEKNFFKEVWVRESSDSKPRLTVVNNYYGPVQATLKVKCKGCTPVPSDTATIVVGGDSEAVAVHIEPTARNWTATYEISLNLGDPAAEPDPNARYGLPVPMDKYFLITQGFRGSFSHTDEYNKYAIDVAMDIGTPVLAARDGIIMAIEEGFKKAGVDEYYADKANAIYILHDDGTIAIYAHLDMYSSYVKMGDRVQRGDIIARSGNTGFSTGPHLHFNVQKNFGDGEKSIPIVFDKGKGESFIPIAGQEVKWDIYSRVDTRVSDEYKPLYEASLAQAKAEEKASQKKEEDLEGKLRGLFDQAKGFFDEVMNN